MKGLARIILLGTLALLPCCASVLGIEGEVTQLASSVGNDGAAGDVANTDDAADGRTATDAAHVDGNIVDAGGDALTTAMYHDMSGAGLWSTFDVTTLGAGAGAFAGATFDGRYVYFSPNSNGAPIGIAARYDTQGSFTAGGSWSTFDTTAVNPGAKGFYGAAFDGRYVYFVPYFNTGYDGIITRYDTQASFTAAASWSTFDTTSVNAGSAGFIGAVFDGRYVYFVPHYNGSFDGIVTRVDTLADFNMGSSWSTFDTTTVSATASNFIGAAFDGRHIYFVPGSNGLRVARYDTQAAFTTGGSWSTFDPTSVNPAASNFIGAAFDGRYVYFVPASGAATGGIITRYDTEATFTTGGSWSTFDTKTVNAGAKGFLGAAFDGRFVYFVPNSNGASDGIVTRYDTQATFAAAASWTTFDTTTVNTGAKGFAGAAFDGRYVYFVPTTGVVARFDAKTPPLLPVLPGWNGSFL